LCPVLEVTSAPVSTSLCVSAWEWEKKQKYALGVVRSVALAPGFAPEADEKEQGGQTQT